MKINKYSQRDLKWMNIKLWWSKIYTIWTSWCFLTSLAMLSWKYNPKQLNILWIEEWGFTKWWFIISKKISKICWLEVLTNKWWLNWNIQDKTNPCIGITDHFKKQGVLTHFFVLLPNGNIIDPWSIKPREEWNKYKDEMIWYRHFKFNNNNMKILSKHNYKEIYNQVIKETWVKSIFNSFEWKNPITESEVKYLLGIWLARLEQRLRK